LAEPKIRREKLILKTDAISTLFSVCYSQTSFQTREERGEENKERKKQLTVRKIMSGGLKG
jgi:hypothetical protein